jgi:hypothetical protein
MTGSMQKRSSNGQSHGKEVLQARLPLWQYSLLAVWLQILEIL